MVETEVSDKKLARKSWWTLYKIVNKRKNKNVNKNINKTEKQKCKQSVNKIYFHPTMPKIMKQLGYVILHTLNTLTVQWKDILDSHISLNPFKIFSRAPAGFEFQFGYSN